MGAQRTTELFWVFVTLGLLIASCADSAQDGAACTQDRDCATGLACIGGACKRPGTPPGGGETGDSGARADSGGAGDAAPGADAGTEVDAASSDGAADAGEETGDAGGHDSGGDPGEAEGGEPDSDVTADGGIPDGAGSDTGQVPDSATDTDASPDDAGEPDAGSQDSGADAGGPREFSVMTINLKHPLTGIDEGKKRLEIVAAGLNDKQPDVVALQEVVRETAGKSFAELLAETTGYQWVWEFAYTVPMLFDEGIGILSRWPIVWSQSAELPHLDLVLFRRRVLGGLVDSPLGEIRLFCTHMTTDSNETVKADQALAIYDFINANPSPLPGFLAGDLNAEPDTLAMRFFRGEASHEGKSAQYTDSWMAANPGDPGFTMTSSNPEKRIDYIYVVPGQSASAEVTSCEKVFAEPVGGIYASDHIGVFCRFTIP